jgi:hypothetical protein
MAPIILVPEEGTEFIKIILKNIFVLEYFIPSMFRYVFRLHISLPYNIHFSLTVPVGQHTKIYAGHRLCSSAP